MGLRPGGSLRVNVREPGVGDPPLLQEQQKRPAAGNTPERPSIPQLSCPAMAPPHSWRLQSIAWILQNTDGRNGGTEGGLPDSPGGLLSGATHTLWMSTGLLLTDATFVSGPRFLFPGAQGLGWGWRRSPAGWVEAMGTRPALPSWRSLPWLPAPPDSPGSHRGPGDTGVQVGACRQLPLQPSPPQCRGA